MSGTAKRMVTYVVTDAGIHIEMPVLRSRPRLAVGALALVAGIGWLVFELGFLLYVSFTVGDFLTGVATAGLGLIFIVFRSLPALLLVGGGVDGLWGRLVVDLTADGLRTGRPIGPVRIPVPAAPLHPRQIGAVTVGHDHRGRPFISLVRRRVSMAQAFEPLVRLGAGYLDEDEALTLRNRLAEDLGLLDDGTV